MYLIRVFKKLYFIHVYTIKQDCKTGKCIQLIDPAKDNKKQKGNFSCVRCIALDASESWLVSIYSMIWIFPLFLVLSIIGVCL